jgi:aminopeptidase N
VNRSRTMCGVTGLTALLLFVGTGVLSVPTHAQTNPFKPPRATPHYARNRDYHVSNLKLIFDINAKAHSAHGVVTHTLAPLRDGLTSIVLDAGDGLKILGCKIDGVTAKFSHAAGKLTILPNAAPARDKAIVVEVVYDMPGGGKFGGPNGAEGAIWIDPRPNAPDRSPEFWTQGETDGNHQWVPCYDAPNDKCTSETITTVPDNWEVIGNGTQGPTTHDTVKHTKTFRWKMTQPHSTYLLSLVAGELDVVQDKWEGKPLYYVVPKGKGGLAKATFGNTPDMLSFFSKTLGVPYAWPKYAQSAVFDFPGGMENVSATTLGVFAITDSRSGLWPSSSLTSHELAHQWFGDLVTCKDWGDIWLNESFATFFEMLYEEHLRGKETYDNEVEGNTTSYKFAARRTLHPLSTTLYPSNSAMFDQGHTYAKGGVILHMLRRQLGDVDFFRGLGHYLKTNAYKPVDSYDLIQAFAEETGINVEPFFAQWIFKPGMPVLDFSWTYDEDKKEVVAHVKQTQDTSDGVPVYNTPLTFALLRQGSTGNVERIKTTLNAADQEFRFPAAMKPNAVLIDPDHDLLKDLTKKTFDMAEAPTVLRYAPCHLDRRTALNALVSSDTPPDAATVKLLTDSLRTETADSVGATILTMLGSLKQESLRPLFREEAKGKLTSRRLAAMYALAQLPAMKEDTALLHTVAMSDTETYPVVEAALSDLGKLDTAGNMDAFRHQVGEPSINDRLANNVVTVLSRNKTDAAAPVLLAATAPTHTLRVRTRAVDALAETALNDTTVHASLLKLLAEDKPALQVAVAHALRDRKDKEAVPILRKLAQDSKDKDVQEAAVDAADTIEGK